MISVCNSEDQIITFVFSLLTVPSASTKIAKLSSNSARKKTANAGQLTGKATQDVTTKTITADAIGMAATAVVSSCYSTRINENRNHLDQSLEI